MCLKNLPIIQDDASSSAPKQFADVEPDNSIPEINIGVNTRSLALRKKSNFWGSGVKLEVVKRIETK